MSFTTLVMMALLDKGTLRREGTWGGLRRHDHSKPQSQGLVKPIYSHPILIGTYSQRMTTAIRQNTCRIAPQMSANAKT